MSYYPAYDTDYYMPDIPDPVPHDAQVAITLGGGLKPVCYRSKRDKYKTIANITSYQDGIVVGCTYISNDAVEKIYQYYQDFKNKQEKFKHQ